MNSLSMAQTAESPHGKLKLKQMARSEWTILVHFIWDMNRFYNIWITVFFKRFSLKFSPIEAEYPDTAVINICSNVEYNRGQPIVYTSSTHLNIVGHEFNDESSEIIAKYATLPIGMFALRVCPHDPNKWVHREQIIRWIF